MSRVKQSPDVCRQCGEPNDNGEGWDGLCGNCADREAALQAKLSQLKGAFPELLELTRIYAQLHDGLSNMIESGRLSEKEIPDDYLWLCDTLEKAVIANNALEKAGVTL